MSNTIASGVSEQAPPESPVTPTTTHYQQVAKQIGDLLTAATAQIPTFEPKHATTAKFVNTYAGFSNDFIATVLAAVEAEPELQRLNKFNVVEARDALQFMAAFRPVIDQVETLRANLHFTSNARKAPVVADGLQVYDIAKGLGRDPGSASVAAHVQNMKRDLKRPGPPRKKKPGDTPAPNTVQ